MSPPLGAEGIDATHDVHLLLADGSAEIISAIEQILGSAETSSRLIRAARDLVVRHYDWATLGDERYHIHRNLAE